MSHACYMLCLFNPLKPELNPICYLLALLAHHFLHVSRIRVNLPWCDYPNNICCITLAVNLIAHFSLIPVVPSQLCPNILLGTLSINTPILLVLYSTCRSPTITTFCAHIFILATFRYEYQNDYSRFCTE